MHGFRRLALATIVPILVIVSVASSRMWISPEGCPLMVSGTGDNLYLVNSTSETITSFHLGCVQTTRAGLVEVYRSPTANSRALRPKEAAIDGRRIYSNLEKTCLKKSAAVSPVQVTFLSGKNWEITRTE
jgi:hypothetical protein